MQKEKNQMRPEYLWSALMCIGVALFIVILIVCSSCRDSRPKDESSAEASSEATESQAVSEVSVPVSTPTSFFTVEVDSSIKMDGCLAITTPPPAGSAPLPLTSISSGKTDSYGLSNWSLRLESAALGAFNRMADAFAEKKGKNNLIVDQAYTVTEMLSDPSADADLTTGCAVKLSVWPPDPDGDNIGAGKFLWLADNCNQYGFILRYPAEKSAFTGNSGSNRLYRYVGYEHAAYMGLYHLCLEEYLDALRAATPEEPIKITYTDETGVEKSCAVYYVKASDADKTQLRIRGKEGAKYTVSGNGSDGFIVTCYPEQEP